MRRTSQLSVIVIGLGLAAGGPAAAEEFDGRFYIAPSATYTFFEDAPKDEVGAQIVVGKPITQHLNLELIGSYVEPTLLGTPDEELEAIGIGGNLLYFPTRVIDKPSFFGILGAQAVEIDVPGDTQDAMFIDAGVGALFPMTRHGTSFRAEYRYRYRDVDDVDNFNDHVITVGFHIPLGAPPEPPPAPPAPPPPPEPLPLPPPAPDTTQREPIILQGVNFEFDKSRLTPEAKTILNGVIEALKTESGVKTVVKGHTCNIGTSEYNLGLSNRRADSVKAYLIEGGIDASRLWTRGYGESSPVESNDTEAGRVKNRRVELQVVDDQTCVPPAVGDQMNEKGCAQLESQ